PSPNVALTPGSTPSDETSCCIKAVKDSGFKAIGKLFHAL
ncbi:unnamed protein product, partial [Cuscuta campestris]